MESSLLRRVAGYLWPGGNFWAKPAISLVLFCLVIALSVSELQRDSGQGDTRPAVMLALTDARAAGVNEVTLHRNADLVLSFAFLSGNPDQAYDVTIVDPNDRAIFSSTDFRFDRQLTGRLVMDSRNIQSGRYTLTIDDPSDTSPLGTDTLAFQINLIE
jgi:hypothetical protein